MKKLGFKDGFLAGLGFYTAQTVIGLVLMILITICIYLVKT